jgi:hypothetical protein
MIKFTQLNSLLTLLLILCLSANQGAAFDRPLEHVPKKLLAISGFRHAPTLCVRVHPYRSNGSIRSGRPLVAKTQNAGDDEAQRLIHRDEKKAGEQNHENNKPRRDQGLAARRPRHFGAFGANLLKEFQRVGHFFGVPSITKLLEAARIRGKA